MSESVSESVCVCVPFRQMYMFEPYFRGRDIQQVVARAKQSPSHPRGELPEVPVYVQEPGQDPVMISARLQANVMRLKQSVQSKLWFPLDAQVMTFNGRIIQNHKSLAFYGVQEGSIVFLSETDCPGPPGGRCLFGHGLMVFPGPKFYPREGCCAPHVRFEMLKCDDFIPEDEPIDVMMLKSGCDLACSREMGSYVAEGSTLCVMCGDQVVIEQSLEGGGHWSLLPPGGWKLGTEYTVLVRNRQGRGVGWTFQTDYIEK